jgi:segregation and condensation protein A
MAATLLEIKSRAMLPRPAPPEEEDPETELIRRLEEYKQFKETAEEMKSFEEAAKHVFTKLPEEYPLPPQEYELTGLTLEGLTEAFIRIWNRKPATDDNPESNHYAPRNIRRDSHTVQECLLDLMKAVKQKKRMRFAEAFEGAATKEAVVTYFLAVLELLKLGQMHIRQDNVYGEIELIWGRAKLREEEDLITAAKNGLRPPRTKRSAKKAAEDPAADETITANGDSAAKTAEADISVMAGAALNAAEDPAAEKTAMDATITAAASDKEKETAE